ncbi:hypothetical protein A6F68_00128 [Tsuneonella dongtanensis]|uniref:DUF3800 domain-containing protein n=1 Tax=Tsuneonella dongtanensis TaxID=692370 RepID=A0A1B2A9B1_9SPHN|nr:DUF3800 domain-containing protein [Tsuneonella dongtanensis]ANY18664.1 hypothetical protein A6F68_00128 [Tsuneonella dongtanensis]
MYRLYIDEVGTDDVQSVSEDNERYLSLTGVAMQVAEARDELAPRFAAIKATVFNHDPDDPIIFHRKKIVKSNGAFSGLREQQRRDEFDALILSAMADCQYRVITALIDKKAMLAKWRWTNKQPYHYLIEVLVEKYVQFLERQGAIGDIMPEGRLGKKDERLQSAFIEVKSKGTFYVSRDRMKERIPSSHLKFRYKRDNVAGLQLADLIAHPSHMLIRARMGHEVSLGSFCKQVEALLKSQKYDRSPSSGAIVGYGMKWLP